MRVLTKTRFKLVLDCPNKLFYTGKNEYINKKKDNPFLEALGEGGFQVKELARMNYPGCIALNPQRHEKTHFLTGFVNFYIELS